MGLIFSGQKDLPGAGGSGGSQQGSTTGVDVASAGASVFQGANNTQVHGGTFNVTGRDIITITNHFHGGAPPDADLVSKIRKWLAPKVDFRSIHIDTFKKRTAGTGKWLLEGEDFQRWLKTKGAILWGTGIAGSGKSVVASIVIDHLETLTNDATYGEVCIACAYSRYTEPISVEEILGSLIDQQVERYPSLAQLVEPLYRHHRDGKKTPMQNELIDVLVQFSKIFKKTFYILDGIDEAPEKVQFKLATVLGRIDANFFLTSRPLENLDSELSEAKTFKVVAHDDDIILLIESILAENPVLRGLLADLAFKREVVETILEKSAGMFLHAALQLAALDDCLSVYDIRSTLEDMPAGLDAMYAITMARIENQAPKHVALAKRILALVVHAEESLSVDDLQYAVIADLETHTFDASRIVDEKSLLSVCCGLIYVEQNFWPTVRLIHFTAKDALQPILLKDYPSPHAFLASTCISRLISCDFHKSNITDWDGWENAFKDRPFLHPAYHTWYLHARNCDPQSPTSRPIHQFLEECLSFPLSLKFNHDRVLSRVSGLHLASAFGLFPFLNKHLDPNSPTPEYNFTPLALSLHDQSPSNESAMHLLALPGIDVNAADTWHGFTPLILASLRSIESVVDGLLQFSEIDVNATDNNGMTALAHAAHNNHEGVVARLLSQPGLEVNAADNSGWTVLALAARKGHEGIVAQLLPQPGLEVNAGRTTALAEAAWNGHEGVVKQLLRHDDIDVEITTDKGMTGAMLATMNGHDSIVRLLLESNPLEGQPSPWGKLMYASKRGHVELIQELLASSDDIPVNKPDEHGYTALILASFYGHETVVQRLLEHSSIFVNLVSSNNYTALIAASERGHEQVVRYLLQAPGIDVNLQAKGTALHYASWEGHDTVVQELLRHPRIDVNALDNTGTTALMNACSIGYTGVVEHLLRHPAIDVNTRCIDNDNKYYAGWTALMFAGEQTIVELLLQHPEIDVNCVADSGETVLMRAIFMSSTARMQRLLQQPGIDVNAGNNKGRTALSIASGWVSADTVKLLLEFPGIDANAMDSDGWTPLMWASYHAHLDTVKLLLDFPGIRVDVVDNNGDTASSLVGGYKRAHIPNIQPTRDALSQHLHQLSNTTSSPDPHHIS